MFDPSVGRWTTEDPIGFTAGDMNLYRYVGNNPTNKTDPSGLAEGLAFQAGVSIGQRNGFPVSSGPSIAALQNEFNQWYAGEKAAGAAWLLNLDIPPNTLTFRQVITHYGSPHPNAFSPTNLVAMEPVLPEGWEWDNQAAMALFHPNAKYGIRKQGRNGTTAGQQAMYDGQGKLITGGLSAGTPDKFHPRFFAQHQSADVVPYSLAESLDQHFGGRKYRNMYFEVRPPSQGSGAPTNIVD